MLLRSWLAALSMAMAVPAAAAPLEAYGRLPAFDAATLSPSGAQLALIATDGEQRSVAIEDLATKAITARANFGDTPVRAIRWLDERRLLVITSVAYDPVDVSGGLMDWRRAHVFDLASSTLTPLIPGAAYAMNNLVNAPMVRVVDGKPVVFVQSIQFVEHLGYVALSQVDLATGRPRVIEAAHEGSRRWLVDGDGRAVAETLYLGKTKRWILKVRDGSGWRTAVSTTDPDESPALVSLGRDGRSVIYAMNAPGRGREWREARLDGAPAAAPIPAGDERSPLIDPYQGRLLGYHVLDGEVDRYVYFDPADAQVMDTVKNAFTAITVEPKSWSEDRRKVVAWVDRPMESPAYALVDLDTRKFQWIGAVYPGLTAADLGPRSRVRFKAADGLELSGYLTRPPGMGQARNLPLVVFPHDGPGDRDTANFDWWAQALASRGYAVLQINFRGSDGLGAGLRDAGHGQWGRKMQSDLSDGVRALANGGLVDPRRVCIVGVGYGGYAALAGATIDHGVYRCAVSIGGISDLPRLYATIESRRPTSRDRYHNPYIGDDASDQAVLTRYSPAAQAAEAEIPILLIHGDKDTVVPLEQSRLMAEALKKAGKPAELIVEPGADHWLSRGDTRLATLQATVAFLEKNNPPR